VQTILKKKDKRDKEKYSPIGKRRRVNSVGGEKQKGKKVVKIEFDK